MEVLGKRMERAISSMTPQRFVPTLDFSRSNQTTHPLSCEVFLVFSFWENIWIFFLYFFCTSLFLASWFQHHKWFWVDGYSGLYVCLSPPKRQYNNNIYLAFCCCFSCSYIVNISSNYIIKSFDSIWRLFFAFFWAFLGNQKAYGFRSFGDKMW